MSQNIATYNINIMAKTFNIYDKYVAKNLGYLVLIGAISFVLGFVNYNHCVSPSRMIHIYTMLSVVYLCCVIYWSYIQEGLVSFGKMFMEFLSDILNWVLDFYNVYEERNVENVLRARGRVLIAGLLVSVIYIAKTELYKAVLDSCFQKWELLTNHQLYQIIVFCLLVLIALLLIVIIGINIRDWCKKEKVCYIPSSMKKEIKVSCYRRFTNKLNEFEHIILIPFVKRASIYLPLSAMMFFLLIPSVIFSYGYHICMHPKDSAEDVLSQMLVVFTLLIAVYSLAYTVMAKKESSADFERLFDSLPSKGVMKDIKKFDGSTGIDKID